MKQLFYLLFLAFFNLASGHAQKVKIKGKLQFPDQVDKVLFTYRNGAERILDSSEIKKGKFVLSNTLIEPVLATFTVRFEPKEGEKRGRTERLEVFIEPGKIDLNAKDSLKFAKISGSKAHKEYESYKKLFATYDELEATFGPRFDKFREAKDEEGMKSIRVEYQVMLKEKNEKIVKPYIDMHPNSPIVIHIINQLIGYDIDPGVAQPIYDKLSASNKNTYSGKVLKEKIEIARKTSVGAMAMNFTQNDTLDKPVSLSDFKGRYVLLDFWASWCGPCRVENPNVVAAFNKYKDKGFTVLGVSLDREGAKQAWIDAIHKDNLTWTHVSDLKFWDNAVAKEWDIRAIPQNFLIDPDGKIVAKNIRGKELHLKLSEILD